MGQLEAKANATWGKYDEQLKTKDRLLEENITIQEEKKALLKTLEKEQGNLSVYHDKQAKASAAITDYENQLNVAQETLAQREAARQDAMAEKKVLEQEVVSIKKDIDDVNMAIQKVEQEKTNRDHTIRSLNDEIANQDEVINKVNKEKKHISENAAKSMEDMQVAEDKVAHLNQIKNKLESTLDELESSHEKEKRGRANVEKERRKIEGELKVLQETVSDLERTRKELEAAIQRKEKDTAGLMARLDDEQSLVAKVQKSIKECQARVEEMEEELEAERQGRAKAERQRQDLASEYDELTERLEESGVATAAQMELNKKRDVEINKMRKDVEENNIHHETTLLSLRKKHQDAVAEMSDQIDQLGKLKQKIEKDKMTVRLQLDDTRAATDHIFHEKAVADKNLKTLDSQIGTLQKKIDENLGQLCEYENQNKRFTSENANLFTRLEELAGNASILNKLKIQLNNQLDEAKRMADDEAKERQSLLGRFRTLEHEFDGVKIHFDDEVQQKEDVARQVHKATGEMNHWRAKYEQDAVARIEELEATKLKLQARLAESESTMQNLNGKLIALEKAKLLLTKEIEDMGARVDQANMLYNQAEKKIKLMDKTIGEWKSKANGLSMELNDSQ